jgi:integrase
MTIHSYKNEGVKRQFLEHLKGAKGFADDSLNKHAEAVYQWQIFSGDEDFATFTKEKATKFCEWLKTRDAKTESGTLSLPTQYNYLRRIKKFFNWLADQPDYKRGIKRTDIDFLRLSKKDARIATAGTTKRIPTIEEARRIIEGIDVENEIDMRDRALLSFALVSGMRISALRMKNFDRENELIDQNPGDGVQTKNSKKILTTFFPIGWDEPKKHFLQWYDHQLSRGAQPNDPIFPSTKKGFSEESYSKELVSDDFWSSSGGARKIFEKRCIDAGVPYFHPHSFRHLVVAMMSKTRLTEEEKKAVSLNLGHDNVGTTFGSYGYGGMNALDAVEIVKKITTASDEENISISSEEKSALLKLLKRL